MGYFEPDTGFLIPHQPGIVHRSYLNAGVLLEVLADRERWPMSLGQAFGVFRPGHDGAQAVEQHAGVYSLPGAAFQQFSDGDGKIVVVENVGSNIHRVLCGRDFIHEAGEETFAIDQEFNRGAG